MPWRAVTQTAPLCDAEMAASIFRVLDLHINPEDVTDQGCLQHLPRRPERHQSAFLHDGNPVAEHGGMVEVVQRGNHGQPQPAHEVQDPDLMTDVEVVGWFIQQEDLRLLGKPSRNMEPLPLTAGQGLPHPPRQMDHVDIRKRLIDDAVIL